LNVENEELWPEDTELRIKRKRIENSNTLPHPFVIPTSEDQPQLLAENDLTTTTSVAAKKSRVSKKRSSVKESSTVTDTLLCSQNSSSSSLSFTTSSSTRSSQNFEAAWEFLKTDTLDLYAEDPATFINLLFKFGAYSARDLKILDRADHLLIAAGLKKAQSRHLCDALNYPHQK
jgi:hypothetical protein